MLLQNIEDKQRDGQKNSDDTGQSELKALISDALLAAW